MTRQARLKFGTRRKARSEQQVGFDAGNMQAAEIVLENPVKYGGEASLLVRWARAVVQRLSKKESTVA